MNYFFKSQNILPFEDVKGAFSKCLHLWTIETNNTSITPDIWCADLFIYFLYTYFFFFFKTSAFSVRFLGLTQNCLLFWETFNGKFFGSSHSP